jgi:VanZ family protein
MRFNILSQVRVAAWALALAIIILSFVPPDLRPDTGAPHYLEHFCIYVIFGTAFAIGYNEKQGLLAILFVIFAGSIEIAQLFVPGRHARLSDFAVDALGAYFGLLAVALLVRIRATRASLLDTRQNGRQGSTQTKPAESL